MSDVRICAVCGVPDWLNPIDDHLEWLGHEWEDSDEQEQ